MQVTFLLITEALVLCACHKVPQADPFPEPTDEKDYTVMFYGISEGNLSELLADTYADLKGLNSSDKVAVTGQLKFGSDIQESTEPLCDFIKWSMKKYPAKNYILILWGHGEGWSGHTKLIRAQGLSRR